MIPDRTREERRRRDRGATTFGLSGGGGGGGTPQPSVLLMETSGNILLEDGFDILLEKQNG